MFTRTLLLIVSTLLFFHTAAAAEEVELAEVMGTLQRYSQKLGLSIQAKNQELAQFYLHEVQELSHELSEIKSYEKLPIGDSVKKVFKPSLTLLKGSLGAQSADWDLISRHYQGLIASCNACHAMNKHGFIVITEPAEGKPFNQLFEVHK